MRAISYLLKVIGTVARSSSMIFFSACRPALGWPREQRGDTGENEKKACQLCFAMPDDPRPLPARVAWGRLLVGSLHDAPTEEALVRALEFAATDKVAAALADTHGEVQALIRDSARHRDALAAWSTRSPQQGGPAIDAMQRLGADCIDAALETTRPHATSLRTSAHDCLSALMSGWG